MAEGRYGQLYTRQDVELMMSAFGDRVSEACVRATATGRGVPEGWARQAMAETIDAPDVQALLTFPADEPLFLLRGQWVAVAGVVDTFADFARSHGWPGVEERVRAEAEQIARWQTEHPDRLKVPD